MVADSPHHLEHLDEVIAKTVAAIAQGKNEIYGITEDAREEYRRVEQQAEELRAETRNLVDQVDECERQEVRARLRLLEVSRDFRRYTEEDIQWAYSEASNAQAQLASLRERERLLRQRRDEMERQLRHLEKAVQRAEKLVSQVGVAMDYLQGNLSEISVQLGEARQKQHVAVGIIRAQEEERRRVAREIHDGPAQSLANLVFRVELCQRLLQGDSLSDLDLELDELKGLIQGSLQEVRQIIFDLRPMALDDLGLLPALRRFGEGMMKREGVLVELVVHGTEEKIPSALEVGLFRITQEAITNALKHARADSVQVIVSFSPRRLMLQVRDDGLGFDPVQAMEQGGERGHFGLVGMQERAGLLGGSVEVESAPGQGTRVRISVPIREEEEEGPHDEDTGTGGG